LQQPTVVSRKLHEASGSRDFIRTSLPWSPGRAAAHRTRAGMVRLSAIAWCSHMPDQASGGHPRPSPAIDSSAAGW
jgi:hypothetical protein